MKRSFELLASTRHVRRERAIAELAAARQRHDHAHDACERARADVANSRHWHLEALSRCTSGQRQDLTVSVSVVPACAALLEVLVERLAQAEADRQVADEHWTDTRRQHASCERDTLRLDEWQRWQRSMQRREHAAQENIEDDERPPARTPVRLNGAAPE